MLAEFRARGLGTRSSGIGAYAALEVWAQAVERADSFELPEVADMLRRGRFDSVLGSIAFDDKGDLAGASWQWQRWSGGSYAPLIGAAADEARASDGGRRAGGGTLARARVVVGEAARPRAAAPVRGCRHDALSRRTSYVARAIRVCQTGSARATFRPLHAEEGVGR